MTLGQLRMLSARFSRSSGGRGFFSFSKLVAFISVLLGSMALVLSLSVLGGFEESLHTLAYEFSSHIQLHPRAHRYISESDEQCSILKKEFPQIVAALPVIQFEALLYRKGLTEGIVLQSDLPESNGSLRQRRRFISGRAATSNTVRELCLGNKLARKLDCSVGDTVIVSLSGRSLEDINSVQTVAFSICGIYESGMTQYDDLYAYAPSASLVDILAKGPHVATSLELWISDPRQAEKLSRKIEERFDYAFQALSVEELHRGMFSWIELQKKPVPIVLGLISIVAVFNIVTTLLISIVEKSSSYAILMSIGLPKTKLLMMIAWQGCLIALLGSVCGCIIALLASVAQQEYHLIHLDGSIYFVDTLPIQISVSHYLLVLGLSIVLGFLATLIPGVIASRISPVRALRFK